MSLSLQLALEDMAALFLGPSSLMADPMGPLLDQEEAVFLSSEGPTSPAPSFSPYASSPSLYPTSSSPTLSLSSPPPSPPPMSLGSKAGTDLLPFAWLGPRELLDAHIGADDGKEDAFSGMDWMAEKIDLDDFDLDSLIGSCASDESPSSPEEFLASLESNMDLDPFTTPILSPHEVLGLGIPMPDLPPLPSLQLPLPEEEEEVKIPEMMIHDQEVVVKSEPPSPAPSPSTLSPTYTLEIGSEVDVLEVNKSTTIIHEPTESIQTTPSLLSLSPAHFEVVLTPKEEPTILPTTTITSSVSSSCDENSDGDSGIDSVSNSPLHHPSPSPTPSIAATGSSRTKPYSKPDPETTLFSTGGKVKTVSGVPKVVEKKLKKMEQNKTAATRYRHKKRVEQEVLSSECDDLEKRNRELAEKADSISREIQYLKDLMEEVRSAKNRKSKSIVA